MRLTVNRLSHRFGFRPRFYLNPKRLSWKVRLSKEFAFNPKELIDTQFSESDKLRMYEQINKLIGVGHLHHHLRSARFGFRPRDEDVEIWAYSYTENDRDEMYLTNVPVDKIFRCAIECRKDGWTYHVHSGDEHIEYDVKSKVGWYKLLSYRLLPYFGGTIPSPRRMGVVIERT